MEDFKTKTLRQIKLWAWAAAVLPITALAGIFFIWTFAPKNIFGWAMIAGEITMFAIAVAWWWWAMYTIRELTRHWERTRTNVVAVLDDVIEIKNIVQEVISPRPDK